MTLRVPDPTLPVMKKVSATKKGTRKGRQGKSEIAHYNAILLEEMRSEFKAVAEAVEFTRESLGTKIDALESRMDRLEMRVDRLEVGLRRLETELRREINAVRIELKQEIGSVGEELSAKIDKIGARLDRHEEEITRLKEGHRPGIVS